MIWREWNGFDILVSCEQYVTARKDSSMHAIEAPEFDSHVLYPIPERLRQLQIQEESLNKNRKRHSLIKYLG